MTYLSDSGHVPVIFPGYTQTTNSHKNLLALEILRQRYARGEIDTVTFEQMRERLENSDGPKFQ